jgi:hypothetical protein
MAVHGEWVEAICFRMIASEDCHHIVVSYIGYAIGESEMIVCPV